MTKTLLIHGTHGSEDSERAVLPFIVGNVAATSDQHTIVFLTSEGVRMATTGYAESVEKEGFQPAQDLIASYISNGGVLWACGACTKPRGITDADLIAGAKIVTAANLVEIMVGDASIISF